MTQVMAMGDGGKNRSPHSIPGSPRDKGEREPALQSAIEEFAEEGNPNGDDALPEYQEPSPGERPDPSPSPTEAEADVGDGHASAGESPGDSEPAAADTGGDAPVATRGESPRPAGGDAMPQEGEAQPGTPLATLTITDDSPAALVSDGGLDDRFLADDLTPNAPAHLNLDNAVEYEALTETDDESGVNERSMFVATLESGDEAYVTLADGRGEPLAGAEIARTIIETLDEQQLPDDGYLQAPGIYVDYEREASVLERIGPSDAAQANIWWGANHATLQETDFDKDSYLSAMALKILCQDHDIFGNILTGSHGKFHPIDFDYATDRSAVNWTRIKTEMGRAHTHYFDSLEIEEVKERTQTMAEALNVDQLEARLAKAESLTREQVELIAKTVREAQRGELGYP